MRRLDEDGGKLRGDETRRRATVQRSEVDPGARGAGDAVDEMAPVRKRLGRSAGGVFPRAILDRDFRNGATGRNAEQLPTAREEDRAVGSPAAIDALRVGE